jgi:hypothetical protein
MARIWTNLTEFYEIVIFVYSVPYKLDGHWPSRFQINQSVIAFKAGIAQFRLGKVVSAWRMNAISKWRYSLTGQKHEHLFVFRLISLKKNRTRSLKALMET